MSIDNNRAGQISSVPTQRDIKIRNIQTLLTLRHNFTYREDVEAVAEIIYENGREIKKILEL